MKHYIPEYISKKLTKEDIKFINMARNIRQPEFLEMLSKLEIKEGISVEINDKVKYANVYMVAKRYSKLLNIGVKCIKREKDVIVIRKN